MDQMITWQVWANKKFRPSKGALYLIKGFVIDNGMQKRIMRLAKWYGDTDGWFEPDMIVESYAQVSDGISI